MLLKNVDLENMPRKERERFLRRQDIIKAALKLFSEKGYTQTTLDDIAEASEFGKGTIYNYFNNKEDIFIALHDILLTNYTDLLIKVAKEAKTFREFIELIILSAFESLIEDCDQFKLVSRMRQQNVGIEMIKKSESIQNLLSKSKQIYKEQIIKAEKNKEIKALDVTSLTVLLQSIFFGYIQNILHLKKIEEIDPKTEMDFITSAFFEGIINR